MAWTPAGGLIVASLAVTVLVLPGTASGQPLSVPASLGEPADRLVEGLSTLEDSSSLDEARQVHRERVRPPARNLTPHVVDLAGRDGQLLETYLERLGDQLAEGNLSNARSLAGAARNVVEEDVAPAARQWDGNRTALGIGPLRWLEGDVAGSLVLVHPPPAGIGAFAARAGIQGPTHPAGGSLDVGRGDVRVEPANGTVRWASFDASALARLDGGTRSRIALGTLQLDPSNLSAGDRVHTHVAVEELVDSNGDRLTAIGLAASHEVPARSQSGLGLARNWLAIGGVALGAVGLVYLARRWEV